MVNRFVATNYSDGLGNSARLSIFGDRDTRKVVLHLYIGGITFKALNMDKEFDSSEFSTVLHMYDYAVDYFKRHDEEAKKGGEN